MKNSIKKIPDFENDIEEDAEENNVITVLKIDDVRVTRNSRCYTVKGIKPHPSYFPSLESTMQEVSDRLFFKKLGKRAEEFKTDMSSLIELLKDHKKEIRESFKIC